MDATMRGSLAKSASGLAFSILLGLVGGMISGSAILSLCALSGRIQTTGDDYIGFWNSGLLLVGSMYGGPIGAFMGPLAYVTTVRVTGFRRATISAGIGSVFMGYLGSLVTPVLGLLTGLAGFCIGLVIARFLFQRNQKVA
jgi:hypothetical protein